MKLESITLTNFRQFYSDQTIKFARDSTRNVTIICGVNGAGKTTLLTALDWCLYGQNINDSGELINKRALTETPMGFSIEMKVQVVFSHEGERYSAIRVLRADKTSEKEWLHREPSFSVSRIRADGQFQTVDNPKGIIEYILPSSVSSYFFFDGEKIDQFARPSHEEEVKSAVKQVLKIEVLERARAHLAAVAKEYRQELAKHASEEFTTLLNKQGRLRDQLEEQRNGLETYHKEKTTAEGQLSDIDDRLGQVSAAHELSQKRAQMEATLKAKESERDRLWESIKELTNHGFIPLARLIIDKAATILDEKRERGEIPPGIREQFVQDLLSRKRCICGRPIPEGSNEQLELTRLLGEAVPSELENIVIQTAGDLRSLYATCTDIPARIRTAMRRKVEVDDDIDELQQKLDDISRSLAGFDLEEVSDLERKRRECSGEIVRLATEIGRTETLMEQLRIQLQEVDLEISKAEVHAKQAKKIQRRFTLSSKAADAVDRICDVFAADMRQQIRKEAKSIFDTLIWKDSQFQDISISDDYHLEVLDRWSLPARRELSAGERQVLSLAFISGMSQVTDEEAPLVMDTPFGRLSSQHRENIATHIPEITKQLVLLITDEELHSTARANIEPRIGAEYELIFDQSTGCTSIRSVK